MCDFLAERCAKARNELEHAGAHYFVDTLAELDPVLDYIDARLEAADASLLPLRKRT